MSPDIALRDPLDHEFVLNRKMAKKYYEDQLQQKMMENRQRNIEEREKKFKSMCELDAKKLKAINDLKKNESLRLTGLINDRRAAEEERKKQRNDQARLTADNIIRQTKKERRIREQILKERKEAYDNKLLEEFERDKKNRQLIELRGDLAAQRERE